MLRQYKIFIRKAHDFVLIERIDIKLYERNNQLKLLSLIQNQLSSTRYESMIQYAWIKSGISNLPKRIFENVIQVNFTFSEIECYYCDKRVFIKCSICENHICFEHFFQGYHFHEFD